MKNIYVLKYIQINTYNHYLSVIFQLWITLNNPKEMFH